ncbi:MAG: biotin--[acetyl-CoA-carboxylase] ligase [Clostridium sp.]
MKSDILRMLREADGYISGQELCEHFHVSRTAVWKVIKQLEAEGYCIEAVRNKGYHLQTSADILSKAELESSINSSWAGKQIQYFDEINSTNTEAKKAAEEGALHGTLVVADCQNQGKGRRGKEWSSPPGTGIWMSLILRPALSPMSASMLTLVAALAVADGIEKTVNIKTGIKWPNDIVCDGKKICGILTEMSTELEWINYVVTGIGINVNTKSFPEEIRDVASSLYLMTGEPISRSRLIGAIMEAYERYYDIFITTCDMSKLIEEYNSRLVNLDNPVKVLQPGHEYTGHSLGINKEGELLVKTDDGEIHQVISGEVSVRGIYGYV